MTRTITVAALVATAAAAVLAACSDQAGFGGGTRDQIQIVGSSTVYPFTTEVAKTFGQSGGNKAPVVESTGTGGGIKQFCGGVGARFPDIVNASRRMKASEFAQCRGNGVEGIMEVQIGVDGIAFAEATNGPKLQLTAVDIFKALAATPMNQKNQTKTWADVNPSLPAIPIVIYGPPSTSGTRDALGELLLAKGCEAVMPAMVRMKETSPTGYGETCMKIREDGPYIDAGENDNLIVQKLEANPNAIGIFGYSYLAANKARLTGVPVNGVEPTYETIASGRYPGARPLYLYVKRASLATVPGMKAFLTAYAGAWSPDGPLVRKGLIAAPEAVRTKSADIIRNESMLDGRVLQ